MNRLTKLVQSRQDNPISIRELARKLRLPQKEVLQACEDQDFNINIGLMITGTGCRVAEFDCIGDYTIEDLNYTGEDE